MDFLLAFPDVLRFFIIFGLGLSALLVIIGLMCLVLCDILEHKR